MKKPVIQKKTFMNHSARDALVTQGPKLMPACKTHWNGDIAIGGYVEQEAIPRRCTNKDQRDHNCSLKLDPLP